MPLDVRGSGLAIPCLLGLLVPSPHARAQAESPPRRAHHALAWDAARQRVVLHGGSTPTADGEDSVFFDDVWEYDGTRWTQRPAAGAKLSGVRLAFDERRRGLLCFGGYDGIAATGELRLLADDGWRSLGVHAEMPVAEAGFVYEPAHDRLLAFGGSAGGGSAHADTWVHSGAGWTRLSVAGPPARTGHVMVHDTRRARTVVFGGRFAAPGEPPAAHADTWEFDGRTWAQVDVAGPPARVGAGAAWDSRRGRVVLFGGLAGGRFLGDTWAWDGERWERLSESGPEPRAMGALAFDESRERVVLFGGRKGYPDGDLGDTWELDGTSWRRVLP